jgi:hypothetical protein
VRDYGKVASTFWTGETGRRLRADRDGQVVAMYLLTGPLANMIGLYHLPVALLSDHTGIPFKGASKALRRVCETGFCRFEGVLEHVFVPEMAAYQIGEPLKVEDKRVAGVISLWQSFRKSPFYLDFHARYKVSFHLPEPSPLQGPSKPLRSQEQEQEQEQEGLAGASAPEAPRRRRKPDPLFDAIAEVTGSDPHTAGSHIARVRKLLAGADPPYSADEVREFGRRFGSLCTWGAENGEVRLPTVGEVEKYIGRVRKNHAATDPELAARYGQSRGREEDIF